MQFLLSKSHVSVPFSLKIEYNLLCIIIEKYSENVHKDITIRKKFPKKNLKCYQKTFKRKKYTMK